MAGGHPGAGRGSAACRRNSTRPPQPRLDDGYVSSVEARRPRRVRSSGVPQESGSRSRRSVLDPSSRRGARPEDGRSSPSRPDWVLGASDAGGRDPAFRSVGSTQARGRSASLGRTVGWSLSASGSGASDAGRSSTGGAGGLEFSGSGTGAWPGSGLAFPGRSGARPRRSDTGSSEAGVSDGSSAFVGAGARRGLRGGPSRGRFGATTP